MSHYPSGGRGARPSQHSGQLRRPEDSIESLWPGYLKDGYFDENGHLRIEYVCRDKFEALIREMCPDLSAHQIRRYFGHCRALETRLKAPGVAWESVWPEVKKLDVAAADGAAEKPGRSAKIPALFRDFIRRNVDKIKCQKDFLQGFLPHFEALVGFGQAHFRKERS